MTPLLEASFSFPLVYNNDSIKSLEDLNCPVLCSGLVKTLSILTTVAAFE